MTRLTPELISEIRRLYAIGMWKKDIAAQLNISRGSVDDLIAGRTYADVITAHDDAARHRRSAYRALFRCDDSALPPTTAPTIIDDDAVLAGGSAD